MHDYGPRYIIMRSKYSNVMHDYGPRYIVLRIKYSNVMIYTREYITWVY